MGNPFGQPAPQNTPYGQPPAAPPGNPFGQPAPQNTPYGQPPPPTGSPFGQPPAPSGGAFGQPPAPSGSPFGQPPAAPPGMYGPPPGPPASGAPFGQPFGAPPSFQGGYAAGPAAPHFRGPAPSGSPAGKIVLAIVGVVFLIGLSAGLRAFSSSSRSRARRATTSYTTPSWGRRAVAARDPAEQMGAKLDPYVIRCLNRFSRHVLDSRDRYHRWADPTTGPTGRERTVLGVSQIYGDPSECTRAVTQAAAMPPSMPQLEATAARYNAALAAVAPLINQAHTYYQRENWRDDGMARGRALHAPLERAWDEFAAAHRALSDQVGTLQDQSTDALLARIQSDPSRRMEYLIKNNQRTARRLVRLTHDASVDATGRVTGVPAEAFMALATEYERGVDEMAQFAATHPEQTRRLHMLSSYQSESGDYLRQCKALARRVRDGTPFTDSERYRMNRMRMGYTVDGSPEAVSRAFNDLVRQFNFMW